ncbi:MAG: sorbosone dehydrogenase family protein [Ferruginibacter sp.]
MKNIIAIILIAGMAFSSSCTNSKSRRPQTVLLSSDTGELAKKYHLKKIKLPPGFRIGVYAEVPNARSMTLSPSGILYVGNRGEDKVYAVVDSNKDGRADKVHSLLSGYEMPNGVAFREGNLYVATVSSVLKLENIETRLSDPPAPVIIYDQFPKDTHHGWKFIAFGPDGKLYVPVGAPCNVCDEKDSIYASITRMNLDGSKPEIFARGIRNTVGFTWHPVTKQIWFTDNGRDNLGDDIPSDELNTAASAGMHFGFPYCHQGNLADEEFGKNRNCADYTPPVQRLGAHVAALGLRFYTGDAFGAEYRNQLFIAEHGSWNRSKPVGYCVSLVKLDENGKAISYESFASGWLQPDGEVLGRPVDVQVMPDGSMLVSDDFSGVIYRIWKQDQ